MKNSKIKQIVFIAIVFVVFLAVSFVREDLANYIRFYIADYKITGIVIYIFAMAVVTVLGPVTLLPVLPVAISLWGPFLTTVFTTIGWMIGAIIAFLLSRKYGRKIIDKLVDVDQIEWFHRRIPEKNLFWSVIFFRIVIPVDFVSYALGLFTNMRLGSYIVASLIGTFSSTLFLVYAIYLPSGYKFAIIVGGIVLLFLGYLKFVKRPKKVNIKKTDI